MRIEIAQNSDIFTCYSYICNKEKLKEIIINLDPFKQNF